jgi:hypothetical protein
LFNRTKDFGSGSVLKRSVLLALTIGVALSGLAMASQQSSLQQWEDNPVILGSKMPDRTQGSGAR